MAQREAKVLLIGIVALLLALEVALWFGLDAVGAQRPQVLATATSSPTSTTVPDTTSTATSVPTFAPTPTATRMETSTPAATSTRQPELTPTASSTVTPTVTPTPCVPREYPERRADGSVWLVRQGCDGRYENVRRVTPPYTPTPAPRPTPKPKKK